jgi:hypothetical protein
MPSKSISAPSLFLFTSNPSKISREAKPANTKRIMSNNDNEIWEKGWDRRVARRRRKFSYKIRRIRDNDPHLTFLLENFRCVVDGQEVIPPLLKAMTTNTRVENLNLFSVPIQGIAGFSKMLLSNSSLQSLALRDCDFSWLGTTAIFRSLTSNNTLTVLDLSRNSKMFRGDNTIVVSAIRQSLPLMTGLKSLNLSNTGLTPAAVEAIFYGLQRNTSIQVLDLSDNLGIQQALADSLIKSLPQMNGLEILNAQLTNASSCLDQQPEKMAEFSKAMEVNTKLWKLDSIVLHTVDYYSTSKEKQKQIQCFQRLKEIDFYKVRNGLLRSGWLTLNRPSLWPLVLAKVGSSQRNDAAKFHRDIVFFLLREKCDLLFLHRNKNEDTITASAMARKPGKKRPESTRRKRPRTAISSSPEDMVQNPGFYCRLHGGVHLVPNECCPLETLRPLPRNWQTRVPRASLENWLARK